MSGGSVQIAEKRWPRKDKAMVDFALPYVNGAFIYVTAREDPKSSTTSRVNQTFN